MPLGRAIARCVSTKETAKVTSSFTFQWRTDEAFIFEYLAFPIKYRGYLELGKHTYYPVQMIDMYEGIEFSMKQAAADWLKNPVL